MWEAWQETQLPRTGEKRCSLAEQVGAEEFQWGRDPAVVMVQVGGGVVAPGGKFG